MNRFSSSQTFVVARWTVERMLWSPRTLAMAAITLGPTLMALIFRLASAAGVEVPFSGFGFFSILIATVGFQFVAPMLALFYSSGIVIDETESGALPYIITRPIRRSHLLKGKMVGSFLVQVTLFLPAMVLTFYLAVAPSGWSELGARFPVLAVDAGVALLGLAAYSGLFSLLGTVLRRPVLTGLVFVFGWQAAATYVPGFVSRLTVAHYLQSLLPRAGYQGALAGLWASNVSSATALSTLLVFIFATHALAVVFFSRKEFRGRFSH